MGKKTIDISKKRVLITGVAGFIGSSLAKRLLHENKDITLIGIDNLNDYYDVDLKKSRLYELGKYPNFTFIKGDLKNKELITKLFDEFKFEIVVHLGAQAGVRYSIINPDVYIESNVIGFYNILELCRNNAIEHLVFASSSSVYGDNLEVPFNTDQKTDQPASLYAATKKSNELFAYAYAKLYHIPITGLRFFTVYGPCGRPDMAYFDFTNKLVNGEKIKLYNYGNCKRDFTYVDDVVEGIVRVMKKAPNTIVPYSIYNIGNSNPISMIDFVSILSEELTKSNLLPPGYNYNEYVELIDMQKGDVEITYSDTSLLKHDYGFQPSTSLQDGLHAFVEWYKDYYDIKQKKKQK